MICFAHQPALVAGPVEIRDLIHMVSVVASSKRGRYIFRLRNMAGEQVVEAECHGMETTSEVIMKVAERSLEIGGICHRFCLEGSTRMLNYQSSPDILRGMITDLAKAVKVGTIEGEVPAASQEAASATDAPPTASGSSAPTTEPAVASSSLRSSVQLGMVLAIYRGANVSTKGGKTKRRMRVSKPSVSALTMDSCSAVRLLRLTQIETGSHRFLSCSVSITSLLDPVGHVYVEVTPQHVMQTTDRPDLLIVRLCHKGLQEVTRLREDPDMLQEPLAWNLNPPAEEPEAAAL